MRDLRLWTAIAVLAATVVSYALGFESGQDRGRQQAFQQGCVTDAECEALERSVDADGLSEYCERGELVRDGDCPKEGV